MATNAAQIPNQLGLLDQVLAESGLACVRTERALTNQELISIARWLGRPIPEHAPAVQPFVEDEFVLNLVMSRSETPDVDLQPFAENPITLHTESSLRSLEEQPRYLIFSCLTAPEPGYGGQTIVVPMPEVHDRLTDRERQILGRTSWASSEDSPPILFESEGRPTFSFRDLDRAPVDLRCAIPVEDVSDEDVRSSIAGLLAALYRPEAVRGIHWEADTLVILDNRRFFHGRLFGRGGPGAARRHLRRLRVRSRPPGWG